MVAPRDRDETEGTVRTFLAKHVATTTGTLSCFERLLFSFLFLYFYFLDHQFGFSSVVGIILGSLRNAPSRWHDARRLVAAPPAR